MVDNLFEDHKMIVEQNSTSVQELQDLSRIIRIEEAKVSGGRRRPSSACSIATSAPPPDAVLSQSKPRDFLADPDPRPGDSLARVTARYVTSGHGMFYTEHDCPQHRQYPTGRTSSGRLPFVIRYSAMRAACSRCSPETSASSSGAPLGISISTQFTCPVNS